jgi:enoyl-CoA hydratase
MVQQIASHLSRWSRDPAVRAVLFTGTGPKAFCAGGDVRLLATQAGLPEAFFRHEYSMNYAISEYLKAHGKPVVSLIAGIVMGGGVGVSMHGNFRVCTESTMFAMPETAIGFFPDVGGTYLLPRLKGSTLPRAAGSVGMYLGLTGARVRSGVDLLTTGIGTHFVPQTRWAQLTEALCSEALSAEPAKSVSTLLDRFHELPMPSGAPTAAGSTPGAAAAAAASEPIFTRESLALLEACFGSHIASVDAALAQLDAVAAGTVAVQLPQMPANAPTGALGGADNSGMLRISRAPLSAAGDAAVRAFAAKTAKELRSKAPLSLRITWRALRENATANLADALRTENRLGLRMTAAHDFKEGVRALLIDKDNKPAWRPATLGECTDAHVDAAFAPLGAHEAAELDVTKPIVAAGKL